MVGKYYLVKCGGDLCPGRVSFRTLRFTLEMLLMFVVILHVLIFVFYGEIEKNYFTYQVELNTLENVLNNLYKQQLQIFLNYFLHFYIFSEYYLNFEFEG